MNYSPSYSESLNCTNAKIAERYRAGGMGYGEAKQQLYEAAMDYFAEARSRREALEKDPAAVEEILQQGAQVARAKGQEVLSRVRTACGLEASKP